MEPTKADRDAAEAFFGRLQTELREEGKNQFYWRDVTDAYLAGVMAERKRCVAICVKREEELGFTGDWAIDAIIDTIKDGP